MLEQLFIIIILTIVLVGFSFLMSLLLIDIYNKKKRLKLVKKRFEVMYASDLMAENEISNHVLYDELFSLLEKYPHQIIIDDLSIRKKGGKYDC